MLPGGRARQLGVLDRLVVRVNSSEVYAGAILVGSLAADSVDAMSDVDLIVVVSVGRFPAAWASRSQLEGGESIAAWDEVPSEGREAGAHKWLTADLVLVEALLTCPSAGVHLAAPRRVVAGPPDLDEAFPMRARVARADMKTAESPIEAAYDRLKVTVRRARRPDCGRTSN